MLIFSSIFLLLIISYCLGLFILKRGLGAKGLSANPGQPFLSVIVAARNEEKDIAACIEHLLNQNYDKSNYEIIIVDDRSEDKTAEIVRGFTWDNRLKLIQIPPATQTLSPKKHAIATAIKQSRGEIIITTDADCLPPSTWLTTLVQNFSVDTGMVAGYNPYRVKANNLFQEMLALDYFSMAAVAAATAGLGFPVSCTGGNLAYRRKAYEKVGGFEQHAGLTSGDDDLFLEQLREKTNWKIVYCTDPKSFVPTKPPEAFKAFAQQRIRYASKGRHYKWNVTLILILVYFINLLLVISPAITAVHPDFFSPCFYGFVLKIISEFVFLKKASFLFRQELSKPLFILASIVHPIYISLAGIGGLLFKVEWKGQKIEKKSLVTTG